MVKWTRSRERAKRVPLTMGQGEMAEEEGKSEAPLTLPHGCFANPAIVKPMWDNADSGAQQRFYGSSQGLDLSPPICPCLTTDGRSDATIFYNSL